MVRRWFHKYTALVHASRLQRLAATGLVALALISLAQSNLFVVLQKQIDLMLSAVLPGVIVELTNEERVAHALGNLTRNPVLDEAARMKAMHMRSGGYFAHWSPEGVSPWFWFEQAGYDYAHAGENLAIYFDDSDKVVDAWMESPLHRENILRSEYTEIGVAAIEGKYKGYDTVYVVQLFGTPASPVQPVVTTPPLLALAESTEENVAGESIAQEEVEPIAEPEEVPVAELPETVTETDVEESEPVTAVPAIVEEEHETPVTPVLMGGGVAYVSDHAATSTGKLAGPVEPATYTNGDARMPQIQARDTQRILQTLYLFLAFIVAGLIIVSIVIAERHLHHTQAAYGASLFVLMLGLVSFHTYFVHVVHATL